MLVGIALLGMWVEPRSALGDPIEVAEVLDPAEPHRLGEPKPGAPLWISLGARVDRSETGLATAMFLAFGGSFEKLARPKRFQATADGERPTAYPSAEFDDDDEARAIERTSADDAPPTLDTPRILDGHFARVWSARSIASRSAGKPTNVWTASPGARS